MRRRRLRNAAAALLAALAFACLLAIAHPGSRAFARSLIGSPDSRVVRVADEAQLRAAFDARPDTTRVVAWLSPT